MREIALKIGKPTALTAIATEPENFDCNKPAVIIFNSGVMHHTGTCRISVKIARQLADAGFLALRFDFSAIGDSEARRGTQTFNESAVSESKEVMDFLQQKKGISKFIAYGLCSGADASYEIAKVDNRIVGIAQIDAYCYTNYKWFVNRYIKRALHPSMWPKIIMKLLDLVKPKDNSSSNGVEEEFLELPSYIRVFPPKNDVADSFQSIVDRNIHIYTIFTGDMLEVNYQNQFREVFSDVDFKHLLREEYYPELEHIITSPTYQKIIPDNLTQWVEHVDQQVGQQ